MRQVSGGEEGHFRPLGLRNPKPIHLKIGMFDYDHSPTSHAKYGSRRTAGVGWA